MFGSFETTECSHGSGAHVGCFIAAVLEQLLHGGAALHWRVGKYAELRRKSAGSISPRQNVEKPREPRYRTSCFDSNKEKWLPRPARHSTTSHSSWAVVTTSYIYCGALTIVVHHSVEVNAEMTEEHQRRSRAVHYFGPCRGLGVVHGHNLPCRVRLRTVAKPHAHIQGQVSVGVPMTLGADTRVRARHERVSLKPTAIGDDARQNDGTGDSVDIASTVIRPPRGRCRTTSC